MKKNLFLKCYRQRFTGNAFFQKAFDPSLLEDPTPGRTSINDNPAMPFDYKSVFQKGKEIGVKWYILEMDKYNGDVYAAVDSSLAYIEKRNCFHNPGQKSIPYLIYWSNYVKI